jgi:hypothetical protein
VVGWFLLGGAIAGWLWAGLVPVGLREPHLHPQDFVLARKGDQPLTVAPGSWCFLPFLYGDFDLELDVELGEGVDLDLLLRQVEPRRVAEQMPLFPGRFTALRLSTTGNGAGWRSRDELLAAPGTPGVELAAGLGATVWVQGRGRELRANVAGRALPVQVADDEYGMVTLLTHGGPAVVHRLVIQRRGDSGGWRWARSTWALLGALGAGCIAAAAAMVGAPRRVLVFGAILPPLLAWTLSRQFGFELQWPPLPGLLCGLATSLALSLLWLRGPRLLVLVVGILVGAAATEGLLRRVPGSAVELFGPAFGAQASEALGLLVRGPQGLHDVMRPGLRVFLLGGQLLYDRGAPTDHLELGLARELRASLGRAVDVPCLPTVDGHTAQQWSVFSRFYAACKPAAIVFGVPREEAAALPEGRPRSTPATLATTLAAARDHATANGVRLVLLADAELPPELLAVLEQAARDGLPLVKAAGLEPAVLARQLADAVLPALR